MLNILQLLDKYLNIAEITAKMLLYNQHFSILRWEAIIQQNLFPFISLFNEQKLMFIFRRLLFVFPMKSVVFSH